jgi:hypothetical protein
METVNGSIGVSRIVWWSKTEGRDETLDRLIGLVAGSVSVGVRQMCCQVGITQMGFAKAATHLEHLAQIRISKERLRQVVEREGRRVEAAQKQGFPPAAFSPEDCRVSADGPTRLYVGADGVMVPMVTQQEKAKRKAGRGRKKKRGIPRRWMRRGADNAYKEFKIATLYEQTNTHRQVVSTGGDHQSLGRLLRREAGRLRLNRIQEKVGLADGAGWIDTQLRIRLPLLDARILDFYHFSEHVHAASQGCFGMGSERAQAFSAEVLDAAKCQGPAVVLARVVEERNRHRSPGKRKALEALIGYLTPRLGMCDYPSYRQKGWDIGSGPTEAMCKVLTYRLKGPGMRWDRPGAEAIMALLALQESNTWKAYWNLQKQAI